MRHRWHHRSKYLIIYVSFFLLFLVNKTKLFYGLLKEPEINISLDDEEDDLPNEDGRPAKVQDGLHCMKSHGPSST